MSPDAADGAADRATPTETAADQPSEHGSSPDGASPDGARPDVAAPDTGDGGAGGVDAGDPGDGGTRLALRITEYPVPFTFDYMTVGPDRNIWFTSTGAAFGYVTLFGSTTAFWYAGVGSFAAAITTGSDGNLWFTDPGTHSLAWSTPAGMRQNFYPPTVRSAPFGIVAGPDGNVWFTEAANYTLTTYNIGRVTPAFKIDEFVLSGKRPPRYITVGPDGNLWFTELTDAVGRITPAGVVTEFVLPTSNVFMNGIAGGPDGALWVTGETGQHTGAFIGRISTSGSLTTFPLPNPGAGPQGIAAGPDGNLWFVEQGANLIGRISPDGTITEFTVPTPDAGLQAIIVGPDRNLWYSATRALRIGTFPTTPVLVPIGGGDDGGADGPTPPPDAGDAASAIDRPADLAGDTAADSATDRGPLADAGPSDGGDAGSGTVCGFTIPNPASAGLPNPAQYDTSTAGIVKDVVTGLVWERAVGGHQASTGCSLNTRGELACPFRYATATCAASRLGGFSDWRLPTIQELGSLVDFTTYEAAIDATAFPSTQWEPFWSGTRYAGHPDYAWSVDFRAGIESSLFIDEAHRFRCVRTGTPSPNRCYPAGARFHVQGTEVADASTGLTWQRSAASSAMSFASATSYCGSLGNGYRLPSVNELFSIVEFGTNPSSGYLIDTTAFASLAGGQTFFWTSSPNVSGFQTTWLIDFQSASLAEGGTSFSSAGVRCVR